MVRVDETAKTTKTAKTKKMAGLGGPAMSLVKIPDEGSA
jgi:hypothetical protein